MPQLLHESTKATRRLRLVSAAAIVVAGAACSPSDATNPLAARPADSTDVASLEISFARSVPELNLGDTVTVTAIARDIRGNTVSDAVVTWGLTLGRDLLPGETIGSVVSSGPRTAVLTLETTNATVYASAPRRSPSAVVEGRLFVAATRRWRTFVWSAEAGFTAIPGPPGMDVVPSAINNRGQIVGKIGSLPYGTTRAFMWSASTGFVYLDGPNSQGTSVANAINESGAVTGWATFGNLHRAFVWTQATGAKMISSGETNDDAFTEGVAINSAGEVAIRRVDGPDFVALRWKPSGSAELLPVTAQNPHSDVVAMNDAGEILGYDGFWGQWDASLDRPSPILWTAEDKRIDLGCNRLCSKTVGALNNLGDIAGAFNGRAFRTSWGGSSFVTLDGAATVVGMNDVGDVVGTAWKSGGGNPKGWLWTVDGKVVMLGVPAGAQAAYPHGINNKGQVVGEFY